MSALKHLQLWMTNLLPLIKQKNNLIRLSDCEIRYYGSIRNIESVNKFHCL